MFRSGATFPATCRFPSPDRKTVDRTSVPPSPPGRLTPGALPPVSGKLGPPPGPGITAKRLCLYQPKIRGGVTIFTLPPPLFSLSSMAVTTSFSNSTSTLPISSLVVCEYWRKTRPVKESRTVW